MAAQSKMVRILIRVCYDERQPVNRGELYEHIVLFCMTRKIRNASEDCL